VTGILSRATVERNLQLLRDQMQAQMGAPGGEGPGGAAPGGEAPQGAPQGAPGQ
jgi:FKBP-type peptidyl-prolyl cis-trans isomerase FkpA